MEMALLRPAVVRGRSPIVEGRRFNGRPAVSKTASGGSNPSAPATVSDVFCARCARELWFPADRRIYDERSNQHYAKSRQLAGSGEGLLRGTSARNEAGDVALLETGASHHRRGAGGRICVWRLFLRDP